MARFTVSGGDGSGIPGPQGPSGDSAYDIAVENGFVGTEQDWLDSLNGTADLIVPVVIKDTDNADFITFDKTGTGTARIGTPQDDLSLRSARDITLFAGSDGPGNVYIGWGDAVYTPDSLNRVATIGDIESVHGDITFEGVKVIGAGTAAGDGSGNGTIEIVPDNDLYANNQYLIVDPTAPNHIHIRAGGTQDASNAELILGGEQAQVKITDYNHQVNIQSYNSATDVYYTWNFANDGTLYGPAMGGVVVTSLWGAGEDYPLSIASQDKILLNGTNGEFLNDPDVPENQIATIGDIESAIPGSSVRYSPTFTATDLTFTGSGTTYPTYNSYYVKTGKMVSFVIEVDLSTVTNFGTGQYKLQLPFTPAVGYNHFTGWANVDPAVNPDVPTGHVILNVDHAGITDILDLHYLKQAGGAHTPIVEGLFLQGTPVTLTTSSKIYINGTYISQ